MEKKIICGIYKITSPSGRVYIGQSVNINYRWYDYTRLALSVKSQKRLWSSFMKYGVKNHQFDIIEYCLEEELNCSERFWQDQFDVLNGGLNLKLTECGELKYVHSEETKIRISESLLGKFAGEKHPLFGIAVPIERKIKIGKGNKDKVRTQETKDKIRNTKKGVEFTQEWRDNIGKSKKGENHPLFGKTRGKHHGAKLVINTQTGVFYDCVKDAADLHNIKYSTLKDYLKGRYPNKSYLIYC